MSNKFEQLLDYLVNEEMDKANALFHEIVVEKSRDIYENLIAEEADEDDEEDDEEMDEGFGAEEDEESMFEIGGDASDDLVGDVSGDDGLGNEFGDQEAGDEFGSEEDEFGGDEFGGDEFGSEDEESPATKGDISDLASALEELKAEFQSLLAAEEEEGHDFGSEEFGSDDDEEIGDEATDDEEGDEGEEFAGDEEEETDDEEASEAFMREYRETIGKPYGSGNGISGKSEEGNTNKTSPISKASGRPTTSASAGNIAQSAKGADPKPGVGGVLKKGGEFVKGGTQNVGSTQAKGYSDKSTGHGAEKKGSGEQGVNTKPIIGK